MTLPLRLLIIHPALPPYRLDLFNALGRRYRLRLVFLMKNLASQPFDQASLRKRLTVEAVDLTRGFTVKGRIFRTGIVREVRRFAPDVVVTQEFSHATLAVAAAKRLTRARYRHVVWTDDSPTLLGRESLLRSLIKRWVVAHLDGLIVLSSETARLYQARYTLHAPTGVSPLLHSEQAFRSRLGDALAMARQLANTHALFGRHLLLYVGRLAPEKRVDRCLHALAALRPRMPDAMLAVVGDGPERRSLERLARELEVDGATLFAGRQEREALHAWYALGSTLLLTSESETFGAVVNEALLSGMPVVCSDRAGARTLVTATNGAIVDPTHTRDLVAAVAEWATRTGPVTDERLASLRPSIMPLSFDDSVNGFDHLVRAAYDHAHRASERREVTP